MSNLQAIIIPPESADMARNQIETEIKRLGKTVAEGSQLEFSLNYLQSKAKGCGGARRKHTKKAKKGGKKHKKTRKH
jgi:hypothetical protein